MKESIYILLIDSDKEIAGEEVGIVTKDEINHLSTLVAESEKLSGRAKKLRDKSDKVKRHANKLLHRIVNSHGITYKENQAVGIAKETDVLYIGELERIVANPEAEPIPSDVIVGSITKYERRKHNELTDSYNYLANMVQEHNELVKENENNLIAFEEKILHDKEYDKENQYLAVYSKTGKILLANQNK
jgi:hypothetical protein